MSGCHKPEQLRETLVPETATDILRMLKFAIVDFHTKLVEIEDHLEELTKVTDDGC